MNITIEKLTDIIKSLPKPYREGLVRFVPIMPEISVNLNTAPTFKPNKSLKNEELCFESRRDYTNGSFIWVLVL